MTATGLQGETEAVEKVVLVRVVDRTAMLINTTEEAGVAEAEGTEYEARHRRPLLAVVVLELGGD